MEFNLALVHEAVAAANPDRECVVWGARRWTWAETTERSRRFANLLLAHGLGSVRRPRSELQGWESSQDHVALFLHNGNAYLEAMLGSFKARTVPVNVNYRYTADELVEVVTRSRASVLVFAESLSQVVAAAAPRLGHLRLLVRVASTSGAPLVDGAVDYETALGQAAPDRPATEPSPDDLYMLFTGGTTGRPKGVLWRQADAFVQAMGGRRADGREFDSIAELLSEAATPGLRIVPAAPFMHGSGHWAAFTAWTNGGTVIIPSGGESSLSAEAVWDAVEAESAHALLVIGDAVVRPLVEELRRRPRDLSSLLVVLTGGAPLSRESKGALRELAPALVIVDTMGSSESGIVASEADIDGTPAASERPAFVPIQSATVVDEQRQRVIGPGDTTPGWLASAGRIPLGYLDDEKATRATFPVIAGRPYSVPGDRAHWRPDGTLEVLGRDSTVVNSGGEKIFVEEVDAILRAEPGVLDALCVGRASARWGEELVALVSARPGWQLDIDGLKAACRTRLAGYKVPRTILVVDQIRRHETGKADYPWARRTAAAAASHQEVVAT